MWIVHDEGEDLGLEPLEEDGSIMEKNEGDADDKVRYHLCMFCRAMFKVRIVDLDKNNYNTGTSKNKDIFCNGKRSWKHLPFVQHP